MPNPLSHLKALLSEKEMELTHSQTSAIKAIMESKDKVVKLNGPAGTGKTTLIQAMMDSGVEVVTPTNKSAQVLRQKGMNANTLFSVFFSLVDEEGRPCPPGPSLRFRANDEIIANGYKISENKSSYSPTIIVDESSMVRGSMIHSLSRMCDKLILVGDDCQLPPIKDRTHPKGLFNQMKPTASLTESVYSGTFPAADSFFSCAHRLASSTVKTSQLPRLPRSILPFLKRA